MTIVGLILLASLTGEAPASEAGVRVVVLPLRSYTVSASSVSSVNKHLANRLAQDPDLQLIDPVPMLVEAHEGDWLESDGMLRDGKKHYEQLHYDEAVEALLRSAEVAERTHRDVADVHGARRLRQIYLYLGLARLEQGKDTLAQPWFLKAAQADPSFQPGKRDYSPTARAAYEKAKASLSGAPDPRSDKLATLCALANAEVVVSGGITQADEEVAIDLVIYHRGGTFLRAESIRAGTRDIEGVRVALDEKLPPLFAALAGRPWRPPPPPWHTRANLTVSYVGAFHPDAKIVLATRNQEYQYNDPLALHGVGVELIPWRGGPWAAELMLAFIGPRGLNGRGGLPATTNPEGTIPFGGVIRGEFTGNWVVGSWRLGAGVGVGFRQLVANFQTNQSEKTQVFNWVYPRLSVGATHELSRRTFTHIRLGAEYDVLDQGVAPWTFTWSAGVGVGF